MSQKQSELSYSFPLTPATELAQAITELGVACTEEDITKPTPQSVQAIYSLMLEELAGISVETFERSKGQLLNQNAYKEYYNDALTLQMFHHHLTNVAIIAGINNFSMSDIVRPEGRRTIRILSALINFCKFKQERAPVFDEIQRDVEMVLQRRDQVEFELAREQTRLAELKRKREEDIPKIQAAKERNDAHRKAMRLLHKTQTSTSNEVSALKEEKKRLTDRLSDIQYEIQTASLANDSQKARIVQSPERLRRTIGDMDYSATQERLRLSALEAKAHQLQAHLEHMAVYEQDVRQCLDVLQQVELEMTRLDEADRRLDYMSAELEGRTAESRELETRTEQLTRQLKNAMDKLLRAQSSAIEKREAAQSKIERLREEYKEIAREREEKDKLLVGKKRQIEVLEGKIEEHLAANQAELKALLEEYFRLRDKVVEYQTQLTAKLGLDFKADRIG